MKIVIDTKERVCELVAESISSLVQNKSCANLALAAGRTTSEVYSVLSESKTDFGNAAFFNICDYIGLDENDERRLSSEMNRELYSKLGARRVYSPDGSDKESAASYDRLIAEQGGLDYVLLGIGNNGHIGFNEPATLFDTPTHIVLLTDSTKRMKASVFGGEDKVPETAVSMGLKTICSARKAALVAFGAEKADVIHKLVYGKTSTYVPAAMLQLHSDMILYLDKDAAGKLD